MQFHSAESWCETCMQMPTFPSRVALCYLLVMVPGLGLPEVLIFCLQTSCHPTQHSAGGTAFKQICRLLQKNPGCEAKGFFSFSGFPSHRGRKIWGDFMLSDKTQDLLSKANCALPVSGARCEGNASDSVLGGIRFPDRAPSLVPLSLPA